MEAGSGGKGCESRGRIGAPLPLGSAMDSAMMRSSLTAIWGRLRTVDAISEPASLIADQMKT